MKNAFIFLLICALTMARVPSKEGIRKAQMVLQEIEDLEGNSDLGLMASTVESSRPTREAFPVSTSTSSPAGNGKPDCAPNTPCAWTVYKPNVRVVEQYIRNDYCECEKGFTCVITENDFERSESTSKCRKIETLLKR